MFAAALTALVSLGFRPSASRRAIPTRLTFAEPGGIPLELDLLVPNARGPRPLVVLVHGGAWRRGRRADLAGTMRALAGEGLAAATIDYRLADAPHTVFPGPIADVRCAVRTLRANAPALGLDPDHVAIVGFSAGGHLAALAATASDVDALDDGSCPLRAPSSAVQASVAFYGPHDLRAPLRVGAGADGAIENLLGVSRETDPARAALASPIVHVDRGDPPMMLVHGLRDRVVDVEQSRRMRAALEAAGVPVTSLELADRRHGFGIFPRGARRDPRVARETLAFLRAALGVPAESDALSVRPRRARERAHPPRPARPARAAARRASST